MRRCKVSLTQIDFYTKRSWKVKAEIYSISNRNGDRNGVLNGKTAVVTGVAQELERDCKGLCKARGESIN